MYSFVGNVRKIGGNIGGVDNIVEGEFVNEGVCFEEKREGL